jgi:two-component sensor histidine kinase
MERQVGHLVGLVEDLLDVNRISQGNVQLRRGRVEVATVVRAAVETARSLIGRMGHELILSVPPEPIWLNADPLRLAQVVGNLLNNASKFTENGGSIGLTVALQGEEAEIRVRDNGAGIRADQLPLVFDMFMQVDAPLERSSTGLGIGLALVKNLVEMHGGTVEAHSPGVGLGSEFVVRLPVTHEAAQAQTTAPLHQSLTTRTARRVLLVDDNWDAAEALAMLLKLSGHDTHIAHDGLEATGEFCVTPRGGAQRRIVCWPAYPFGIVNGCSHAARESSSAMARCSVGLAIACTMCSSPSTVSSP